MAPAVRAAIGEAFGFPAGTNFEKQTVAALRKLGFDLVFDTQFSADLTIMEEGYEFLERFTTGTDLPMITSCSPAWIKYAEQFHPEILPNVSSCKSPMSMQSSSIKDILCAKRGIDPKDILSVAVMPCTGKNMRPKGRTLTLTVSNLPI